MENKVETIVKAAKLKRKPTIMYHYWRQNRNVIFAAISLFIVSLTALLFFLNEDAQHSTHSLKANVVDSLSIHSNIEEEEKYRKALDGEEGPFVVLTPEGNIEYVSWDYETMTGYTKEDIKEQPFFSMIHSDDLSKVIAAFGKVIANQAPVSMVGPYRMQGSKGQYLMHIASFHPIVEGHEVQGVGVVVLDITHDVKKSEEEEKQADEPSSTHEGTQEHTQEGTHDDGPKIRDEENTEEEKRLVVEKLAQLPPAE